MTPIKLAIAGVGKIVYDQHAPAISGNRDFELVATASRNHSIDGVSAYKSMAEMLAAAPEIEAVSLCMPPQYRYAAARQAIAAGKHVFLEKPPGATLSEVESLKNLAAQHGVTLFASWHSRHAPAVQVVKRHLQQHAPRQVEVIWREDVRHWHPDQEWIWQPGGLGVFDPGINALSIVTEILPQMMFLTKAALEVPANRQTPIAARLAFTDALGTDVQADFDWRQTGEQTWDIRIETDSTRVHLKKGGHELLINEVPCELPVEGEYPSLYEYFCKLIRNRESDVDVAPLRHVADAFMLGEHIVTDAFV
ncbi:Gfo/Idh/MocA family protein [Herbaspirillum rubrisubalbicans]|uniref:Gfo/Idh/MocA family oxidoreductase n=1 Tax=Herbaspirillum rubrisubalbicans TaxID=80842 RepID=A0AAD0XHQ8_9BURK|nr:Gfo/Idh/MocA family oxidoreductase [Herbaspirillum rubrisubalbicans]ALU89969.1 D-galactose-1-dehydrogenase protein [Herbaspirillum rubrisubalbicans M1]AYR25039.1 gfo/Idh/MocA family oxidoreductase [Herbaspirillum rubrisubalbicans]